jgi:cardiolipin synthase
MSSSPHQRTGLGRAFARWRFVAVVLAVSLGSAALIGSCATLPEGRRAMHEAVRDARESGQAVAARSRAIAGKVAAGPAGRDFLARHLAVEEAVAGKPLVRGNAVRLLEDGPQTYDAIFAAVRAARDHINLETYILEDDALGRRLASLLIDRRRAGVLVNILADGVGSIGVPSDFLDELRAEGINILIYHPVNPAHGGCGRGRTPERIDAQVPGKGAAAPAGCEGRARTWSLNERDHRKLLIVDGRTAFTGGINVSGVYSKGPGGSGGSSATSGGSALSGSGGGADDRKPDAKRAPWRDTHVRIDGPVVADFQRIFLDNWRAQDGPALGNGRWFPPLAPAGDLAVRAITSGDEGAGNGSEIYLTYLSAIASAGRSVWITMGYFVPDDQTLQALSDAAARGVDVRLVLPGFSDSWLVHEAGRSYYDALLAAGVRIHERRDALVHAKTAVIDGVWSTVGSSNLDWRSFLHNLEVNAVIIGPQFAAQMEAMFRRDLERAVEIDLATWRERGVGRRMKEWFGRVWQYWL